VGGRIKTHIPITETFAYVTSLVEGILQESEAKNLEMGNYTALSEWAQYNHKGPGKREAGRSQLDVITEVEGERKRNFDLKVLYFWL
jgi:hypothetical protein